VSAARFVFDRGTGYGVTASMTEAKWLQRFIFLETVAAIPGMVGGAVRHLHSLRLMKRCVPLFCVPQESRELFPLSRELFLPLGSCSLSLS